MWFHFLFAVVVCPSLSLAWCKLPTICYWQSSSVYRDGPYKGNVSTIPVEKCTHIVYAFLGLDESTNTVKYLDSKNDIDSETISKFVSLRNRQPELKVMFAIGGWDEGSVRYSKMASTPNGRDTFAKSVAEFMKKHDFDGVDFHWMFPGTRGGNPSSDKGNFVLLLQAMRKAFGHGKLLTVAVSPDPGVSYDAPAVSNLVDFINVLAFDLWGPWEKYLDIHGLYHAFGEERRKNGVPWLTVERAMKGWVARGVPPSKLTMGIAFHGRSFTSKYWNAKIGTPSSWPGAPGPVSRTPGFLSYFEICNFIKNEGWTYAFDHGGSVPYAFKGYQWVGFENKQSLDRKILQIWNRGYGGASIWAINNDDSVGLCQEGKYPLLTKLRDDLTEKYEPVYP